MLTMTARSCDYFDEAAGRFVCDFVERLPTTETGKPFSLYEWQRSAIMDFYGSMETDEDTGEWLRKYWYLYLEIPKKNGKSELAAALGNIVWEEQHRLYRTECLCARILGNFRSPRL